MEPEEVANTEVTSEADEVASQTTSASGINVRSLEHDYMQMLEQRIAQLQEQIQGNKRVKEAKPRGNLNKIDDKQDTEVQGNSPNYPRIRNVISKWDHKNDHRRDFDRSEADQQLNNEEQVTIFRRYMDNNKDNTLVREELYVGFDKLKLLLSQALRHCAPHLFVAKSVNFGSPFSLFVWQWDALKAACEPQDNDEESMTLARSDLKEILALLRNSNSLSTYFNNLLSHQAGNTVVYEHLWTLFEPGRQVYAQSFLEEMQMFEVQTASYQGAPGRKPCYRIVVAAFDWDGMTFERHVYPILIPKFEGSRPVANLPCFPTSYYSTDEDPDGSKLRESLLRRGRRFWEICTGRDVQFRYDGPAVYYTRQDRSPDSSDEDSATKTQGPARVTRLSQSKVAIDNYSFVNSRRNPGGGVVPLGTWSLYGHASQAYTWACPCARCRDSELQRWFRKVESFKSGEERNRAFGESEDRLLLCPPKVLGYSLDFRHWVQLKVDNVEDVDPGTARGFEEYFEERLELDATQKKLLKAMIDNHVSAKGKGIAVDVVEGKGQGLVILLHGPPGVGKTLTAETVALATGKPLLSVSTAEIGIEPKEAERNLTEIFQDASRWEAVLLIDEADVFLEERKGTKDIQRNSLVAVLLRVLEYYEGIIILTTNRITSLDVAVQSRIHLAIQYRDLTAKQKEKIFHYFLDKTIGEDRIEGRARIDREIPKILRKSRINGRQIRNVIRSAYLLAQSNKSKLSFDHIEEVLDATETFLESLKDLTLKKREFLEAPSMD